MAVTAPTAALPRSSTPTSTVPTTPSSTLQTFEHQLYFFRSFDSCIYVFL